MRSCRASPRPRRSSRTSMSPSSRSRYCRPCITTWVASRPTTTAKSSPSRTAIRIRSCRACTRLAKRPACRCMARTGSARTRCSISWCSARRSPIVAPRPSSRRSHTRPCQSRLATNRSRIWTSCAMRTAPLRPRRSATRCSATCRIMRRCSAPAIRWPKASGRSRRSSIPSRTCECRIVRWCGTRI